jgi:hypothetical protein
MLPIGFTTMGNPNHNFPGISHTCDDGSIHPRTSCYISRLDDIVSMVHIRNIGAAIYIYIYMVALFVTYVIIIHQKITD